MDITVTSCEKAKEVNGKAVYKVGLSDGRFGESFAKEIPTGTPASDIEINDTQWGLKFKLISKGGGFGGGRPAQKPNNAAFSMSYAKDLVVADKVKIDQLIPTADKILNWINSKNV
jgi:hypothetical protein